MISNSLGQVLTFFYEDTSSSNIVVSNFIMDIYTSKIEYIFSIPTITKELSGLIFKKSVLSQNSDVTLLYFMKNNGHCGCLTYNINSNSFSDITIYLNNCAKDKSSLDIIFPSNFCWLYFILL